MAIIGTPQLIKPSGNINDQYIRSYTRTYLVYATIDVDEHYILFNSGISIANSHPSDARSLAKDISVELFHEQIAKYDATSNPGLATSPPADGTPCYVWLLTVEYGLFDPLEHSSDGDPANTPLQIFYEGQTFEEPVDVDLNGNPVVNTAYTPFDPGVVRDRTRPIIRMIKNVNSFSAYDVFQYADKVNLNALDSYPARTLKISAPRASPKYSQVTGQTYYEVEFIFMFNPDTWDKKPLNMGTLELDPTDATKRRVIVVEGTAVTEPVMLDASGHALSPPVDHTNVIYGNFQVYETLDFATAFGFPMGTFN